MAVSTLAVNQREMYVDCLEKQMTEFQLLTSIYCAPGELEILDPLYVCEFEQFLNDEKAFPTNVLYTPLEFILKMEIPSKNNSEKLDVRVQLPHLYPNLEYPIVTVQSALLTKTQTQFFKAELNKYLLTMEKQTPYVFQLLTWIQEQLELLLKSDVGILESGDSDATTTMSRLVDFERLWIYSHHIKSKAKRQEILKQSRELDLSGFSRPGKPGIICVEGLQQHTQEFWRIIKSLHWQKIGICKNETNQVPFEDLNQLRRFSGFKEQLFCENEEAADVVMDMRQFVKFLEAHNFGYMKKELFGIA